MDKRTFFDLLEGESPSDVVLKAMCECIFGELGSRLYYHTIVGGYGGTMKFMEQVNESVLVPRLREKALKFLVRHFTIMGGNKKLTNPILIEYLNGYLFASDYVRDSRVLFQGDKKILRDSCTI